MTDYIAAPPVEKLLSATLGCDAAFSLQRVDSANAAVNFGAGDAVRVYIDIDKANPTQVDATVSGSTASILIPSTICDRAKTGTRFRIILIQGSLETPILVGRIERHDG